MTDMVNYPPHYRQKFSWLSKECIWYSRQMPFSIGNAFKYAWRAGEKDDEAQDWKKSLWYVEDALQTNKKVNPTKFLKGMDKSLPELSTQEIVLFSILSGNLLTAQVYIKNKIKEIAE